MPSPLRICHLITTWYERAGSSRRTLEIIRGLKVRGYEIDLLVGEEASETFLARLSREGIRIGRVQNLQKYVSPHRDLMALWALKRQFATTKYDIVHTHLAKAGILGRLAAKWTGIPVIVHTVHGPSFPGAKPWWQRKFYREMERRASRYTDAMVYVGEELRRNYLQSGIGTKEKSHIIYTGRNLHPFLQAASLNAGKREARRRALGFHADELILGYVGRTVPSKGHILAIQAAERIREKFPNARLFFIGQANLPSEQEYKNKLLAEVESRQLQERVVFLEYQDDIENYYSIFDVFILPSLYEGLPNVVIEAAVMGLPIVAFDCGGVREILGENACIVPRGDVERFAQKLVEVLGALPSQKNSRISSEIIKSLTRRWSIEAMVEGKDRLYRGLLGR